MEQRWSCEAMFAQRMSDIPKNAQISEYSPWTQYLLELIELYSTFLSLGHAI